MYVQTLFTVNIRGYVTSGKEGRREADVSGEKYASAFVQYRSSVRFVRSFVRFIVRSLAHEEELERLKKKKKLTNHVKMKKKTKKITLRKLFTPLTK